MVTMFLYKTMYMFILKYNDRSALESLLLVLYSYISVEKILMCDMPCPESFRTIGTIPLEMLPNKGDETNNSQGFRERFYKLIWYIV